MCSVKPHSLASLLSWLYALVTSEDVWPFSFISFVEMSNTIAYSGILAISLVFIVRQFAKYCASGLSIVLCEIDTILVLGVLFACLFELVRQHLNF